MKPIKTDNAGLYSQPTKTGCRVEFCWKFMQLQFIHFVFVNNVSTVGG
jgi:hypothetical protein